MLPPNKAVTELHAPQSRDFIVSTHESASDRPKNWQSRRNVGASGDFSRSGRTTAGESGRRLGIAIHRLTRVLGRVEGLRDVCTVVARHVARCIQSRFVSLAVPVDDHLAIVATHGYPVELVRMLRIPPGAGVIGAVYSNGTPLLVEDVTTVPGRRRRARYRTNSFIAVPISAGQEVFGVVCVADRRDDQPFAREDLANLRALVAPAALAMSREQARRNAEALGRAAVTDPLSGLFNRRYFHERLEEELDRARRHDTTVALLMIDIDNFKRINDQFGHLAGDLVIRGVGEILKRSVRRFDLCTRFGGEEFAIVMPGSGAESSASVGERIRQRIEAFRAGEADLADLRVTASIGMAVSHGASVRDLIARADQALYEAKHAGKNRLVEWKPPDTTAGPVPRNPRQP